MSDAKTRSGLLVAGIAKLAAYLHECSNHLIRLRQRDNDVWMWLDVSERGTECQLEFTKDGECRMLTWQTSGHNGDSYDHKTRVLDHEEGEKMLRQARSLLERLALQNEDRLEREREEAAAVSKARARLHSIIGPY